MTVLREGMPGAAAPRSRLDRIEVAMAGLVALAAVVAGRAYPLWRAHLQVVCPVWTIFGIPCPTCGGTRAVAAVMRGDLTAALSWNPLVAVLGLAALAAIPYAVAVGLRFLPPPPVPGRLSGRVRAAMLGLLAADWIYLLVTFRG